MRKHIFQSSLVIPQCSIACSPQGRHPSGMSDNWLHSSFFMHSQPPAAEKSEMHLSQLTRAGPNLNAPEKYFMIGMNLNYFLFSFIPEHIIQIFKLTFFHTMFLENPISIMTNVFFALQITGCILKFTASIVTSTECFW